MQADIVGIGLGGLVPAGQGPLILLAQQVDPVQGTLGSLGHRRQDDLEVGQHAADGLAVPEIAVVLQVAANAVLGLDHGQQQVEGGHIGLVLDRGHGQVG